MIAALTGTPGTGKTSIAAHLAKLGWEVVDLGKLVERKGLAEEFDEERQSLVVDPKVLSEFLQPALRDARQRGASLLLEGHLAHLVHGVEVAVVLRCHPRELAERLRTRGWPEPKVRENCGAEALDAITVEACEELNRVLEFDTSGKSAEQAAREIHELLHGHDPVAWTAHQAGTISWGDEVLSWS